MSLPSTYTKLAGLVVALGFFGMGPGVGFLDELKSSLEKRRDEQQRSKDASANVAPPGEKTHLQQQQQQQHPPHLLEGAAAATAIQRHPSTGSKISQETAHEFVTHPFLPVTASRTVSTGRNQGGLPISSTTSNSSGTTTTDTTVASSLPWLSFMMTKPSTSQKDG